MSKPKPTIDTLVNMLSPIVYLHTDERYFPSSIDYVLNNSVLVENGKQTADKVTSASLFALSRDKYNFKTGLPHTQLRIDYPKSLWPGQRKDLDKVPVYALVRENKDTFDIYYILIWPYNGPRRILDVADAGAHYFDLEHLTVVVDKKTMEPIEAFYGAHGAEDGKWVKWSDIQLENGHPIALAALDGHGLYPEVGFAYRIGGLANDDVDFGTRWFPPVERVYFRQDPRFKPETMGWMYFSGRMGFDGVSSAADKPFFYKGDPRTKLTTPPFYRLQYAYLQTIAGIYVRIALAAAIILFGFYQKRVSRTTYFALAVVVLAIVAGVANKIISQFEY